MEETKTAIVTGASGGIGSATALEFARRGYNLTLHYNGNEAAALALKEKAEGFGIKAEIFKADISDNAQAAALIGFAMNAFGRIDALVNNAGITRDALILRMKEEDFDRVIGVNLKGAFNTVSHAAKHMLKARKGAIVNVSSVVGIIGNVAQVNYVSAKAGLIGMTKACAREFAPRGVRVNAVAPGYVETEMTAVLNEDVKAKMLASIPLQRYGQAEDVAKAIAFLCSEDAAYITGQVLVVDGGMVM
jgi:3-oxoacyl-[acyl-carrier protein] reductase